MRGWGANERVGKCSFQCLIHRLGLQPGFQGVGSRAEEGAHDTSPPFVSHCCHRAMGKDMDLVIHTWVPSAPLPGIVLELGRSWEQTQEPALAS